MRLTFVGFLLFASTALGQAVTFSSSVAQDNKIYINASQCTLERSVSWQRTGTLCDKLYIWISNGECTGEPGADDLALEEIAATSTTTTQGTETFRMSQLLSDCEAQTANKTFKICATTKKPTATPGTCESTAATVGTPTIEFILDPVGPAAPPAPRVTGLDKALSVSVDDVSDAERLKVNVYSEEFSADGGVPSNIVTSKEQTSDNTEFRLEGLENDVEYFVRVIAIDQASNEGTPSAPVGGIPVESDGFFEEYVEAGGKETGGCGAGGGGLAGGAVLAALGFWLARRKLS